MNGNGNFRIRHGTIKKELLKKQFCIVLLSLLVSALLFLDSTQKSMLKNGNTLERNLQNKGDKTYELEVRGITEKPLPMEVRVDSIRYKAEEADRVFEEIYENIEHEITEEGEGLDAVRKDLLLPDSFPEYGVQAQWKFEPKIVGESPEEEEENYRKYKNLIREDGRVENEELKEGEAVEGVLRMVLYCNIAPDEKHSEYRNKNYCSKPYNIYVRVVPREYSWEEKLERMLRQEIESRNGKSMEKREFILPEEVLGQKVRFSFPKDYSYVWILPGGLVLALGLYFREIEQKKEEKKKRDMQLMVDYSELVSKLNVYLGAGLTIRNAFLSIYRSYEAARQKGLVQERALYRELQLVCLQLKDNIPESTVYQEFSERIHLRPYTKLISLIEQNRKNGSSDLRALLSLEMTDAFEIRKNTARRLGEESSTKLLLPLLIQLGIVMIVVIVPALNFLN